MMVVVTNAKPLLDQIADHWAGPDARLVASLDRPQLDDDPERFALFVGESRWRPFGDRGSQSIDVIGVVPLEPPVHGATGDPALGRDSGHFPTVDVRTNRTATAPFAEVVLQLRFDDDRLELFQLRWPPS